MQIAHILLIDDTQANLDVLCDRFSQKQQDNLGKVTESADRLLGMINGLLDLSKIEAGRVEVQAELFDFRGLVVACCDEMESLGEEYGKLVSHLRGLRRAHDIEGTLSVMKDVAYE